MFGASHSFDWEELLLLIEDREVIPVIGKELLVVSLEGREARLETHLAGLLAEALALPRGEFSSDPDLNEVVVRYLQGAGEKAKTRKRLVQKKIAAIMESLRIPTPGSLKKLAGITDFNVFVSTTFDGLLRQAIDEVRFGGEERTQSLAYYTQTQRHDDIPADVRSSGEPCVYQIFGPLESSIDFAVTDEDYLETLHRLQDGSHQPSILFDEFRERNLLFLGCGFADGLARVFVRTLANERLFGSSSSNKVVDSQANSDPSLGLFLRHCRAESYIAGNAVEFVDELCDRWRESVGPKATRSSARGSRGADSSASRPEPGSIFLSYKSEDLDKVGKLKDALESAGLQVWFDKNALKGGDDWAREIKKGIESCSLFLPVISRRSQTVEGEFRREWKRALERAERIPEDVPFIIAVLLEEMGDLHHREGDDEPMLIPPEFWRKQALRCLDGEPTPELIKSVKDQMREVQLLRAGLQ